MASSIIFQFYFILRVWKGGRRQGGRKQTNKKHHTKPPNVFIFKQYCNSPGQMSVKSLELGRTPESVAFVLGENKLEKIRSQAEAIFACCFFLFTL